MLILKSLDDVSMANLCQTNKYIAGLCEILYKDEKFWEDRLRSVVHPSLIKKPKSKSWYEYYVRELTISDNKWKTMIKKILGRVHPDTRISKDAVEYLIDLMKPIWNIVKRIPEPELFYILNEMWGELEGIKKHFFLVTTPTKGEILKHIKSEYYSERAGFLFPKYDRKRIIEYLIAEVLELAGNKARDARRITITDGHIDLAIQTDRELADLFGMQYEAEKTANNIKSNDSVNYLDQIELGKYIENETGHGVYFDDVDLVDERSSKTILSEALINKKVKNLVSAVKKFHHYK